MRNLFLALVLANLAFAAWHLWFSEPPRAVHATDADLPSITLVSELPEDLANLRTADGDSPAVDPSSRVGADSGVASEPSDAVEVAASADLPDAAGADGAPDSADAAASPDSQSPDVGDGAAVAEETLPRCSSVGPFRELAQAATAAANLRAAGYQPTQRVAEGDIWIGYWVYIEAIASVEEANDILAKVRAEGVSDSYVIPNSDSGNLVSLGVFSEISGVARRREQMRALGYEPRIVDRTRRATVYWVDVLLAPDQTLDYDSLQTPGRITRLEQHSCEGATG